MLKQMLPDILQISSREKLILAGLYLSKFDSFGLKKLGFESFGGEAMSLDMV